MMVWRLEFDPQATKVPLLFNATEWAAPAAMAFTPVRFAGILKSFVRSPPCDDGAIRLQGNGVVRPRCNSLRANDASRDGHLSI